MKLLTRICLPASAPCPGQDLHNRLRGRLARSGSYWPADGVDVHDGLAGFGLIAVGGLVAVRLAVAVTWLDRLAHAACGGVRPSGSPTVATSTASTSAALQHCRGCTPPVLRWVLLGLVVWCVRPGWRGPRSPSGWREVGIHTSYVFYLATLLCLWVALLACTFVGVFVPVAVIDRLLRGWVGDTDRKGAELFAVVGYADPSSRRLRRQFRRPQFSVVCLAVAVGSWLAYLPRAANGRGRDLWRAGSRAKRCTPCRCTACCHRDRAGCTLLFDVLLTAWRRALRRPPGHEAWKPCRYGPASVPWPRGDPGPHRCRGVPPLGRRAFDPARQSHPTVHVSGHDAKRRQKSRAAGFACLGLEGSGGTGLRERGTIGVEVVEPGTLGRPPSSIRAGR